MSHQTAWYLEAAQDWLELGNHIEANEELEKIAPLLRAHPDVLSVHWAIYAAAKKWETALDIAAAVIPKDPENARAWVERSCLLHEQKRTKKARDHLLGVVGEFSNERNDAHGRSSQ